ncbi:hypothetical protein QE250_06975 [Chromatiaceae bacterium AAb-1]|jgi:hypothetical protein|nr:hypothetical protein [Chromatiaceae bacterium AAb-1]
MKSLFSAIALTATLLTAGTAIAHDERSAHYKGKQSETLEQAVANFSEYNKKLKQALAGEVTPNDMVEIHELTYTLEVALEKLHKELGNLKDVLEELHVASEHMDIDTAKERGQVYLKTAETVIK